jgi:hypothetical protein
VRKKKRIRGLIMKDNGRRRRGIRVFHILV